MYSIVLCCVLFCFVVGFYFHSCVNIKFLLVMIIFWFKSFHFIFIVIDIYFFFISFLFCFSWFREGSIEISCGMPNLFSGLWQIISLDDALTHTKWPLSVPPSSRSSGHLNSISYSLKYFDVAFTLPVHCYRAREKKLYNENKSFFPPIFVRLHHIFVSVCFWTVFLLLFFSFLFVTIGFHFAANLLREERKWTSPHPNVWRSETREIIKTNKNDS